MAYETIGNFNGTGLTGLFQYVSGVVPIFIPMLLFTFFVIVSVGSYMGQIRIFGRGSFSQSFAVASYVTTIAAFVISLIPGLLEGATQMMVMGILIGITILSSIMLLMPTRD